MECRIGCGACCIAPSITTPIPGMNGGKAAGQRCIHLNAQHLCDLFGQPQRPKVCSAFLADPVVCGSTQEEAIQLLGWLEQATAV